MFRSIIVIGYGAISKQVLSHVYELKKTYNYNLCFVEYELFPFSSTSQFCEKQSIPFFLISSKEELFVFLDNKTDYDSTLIISACNNYIFPPKIVNKTNVRIINFHNALLPNLPGRNAPTWAIFENYKRTGITWHYVDNEIDHGEIIIQRECLISDTVKAFELAFELMKMAEISFKEIFEKILTNNIKTKKQCKTANSKIYKSTDIPNNGIINLMDSPEFIFRLLRAMDYGGFKVFPLPISHYKSKKIQIINYKLVSECKKKESEDNIFINYKNDYFLKLSYNFIE